MKFTEVLKQEYKDIISLRTTLTEPILSAAQIVQINTFITKYCEHAKQFEIAINLAQIIIDPLKPAKEQLQNAFTVFDYICYLDIYLSEDNPDKAFFLHPINPEFRSNPIVRRDLVLKIQSYLNKILDKITPENSKPQTYLSLFDEALMVLRTLTFDPISIDDLITNALIKLLIISFTINLIDLDICETAGIFEMLKHDKTGLLKLLTEIPNHLSPPTSASSIFNTCFNNPYYGLGITEYEQLRIQARAISDDLDDLIKEHVPVKEPEESDLSAELDSNDMQNILAIAPMLASAEVTIPRPATPVQQTINPILGNSPTSLSPGLSDIQQATPACHRPAAAGLYTPPPAAADVKGELLLYTPATTIPPGTGDRRLGYDTPMDMELGKEAISPSSTADMSLSQRMIGVLADKRRQTMDRRDPITQLNLDDTDISGEVNLADLSLVTEPGDYQITDISGHSGSAADDSRINTIPKV